MNHTILELYSGIGGMHCAWNDSGLIGKVVAAIDINTVANEVYKYNFPETRLITRNIQSLTPNEIKTMDVDTILMSPPCQPFTRNGKFMDSNDPRTNSFLYIISILNELDNIQYILMENVKGFECSEVRNLFIDKLKECDFSYQEFLLCPSSVGVPNSRLRYYCIARRNNNSSWHFRRKDEIMLTLPREYPSPYTLENIIDHNADEKFLMPNKFLRLAKVLDICYKDSQRSCCFTKAYSHYVHGTGSVFTNFSSEDVKKCYKEANNFEEGSEEFVNKMQELKLRFFTPNEILSLMSFPKEYKFPNNITLKQKYRLLGNSINVKVISELLKILFEYVCNFISMIFR